MESKKHLMICGSRNFNDYPILKKCMTKVLDLINNGDGFIIVSGGAPGVDTMAEKWAREMGYPFKCFPANWKEYGKAAGPIRNTEMVKISDIVVAFPKTNSIGTKDSIKKAKAYNKSIYIFNIE